MNKRLYYHLLIVACVILIFNAMSLRSRTLAMESRNELKSDTVAQISHQCKSLSTELPPLIETANEVVRQKRTRYAPEDDPLSWCLERIQLSNTLKDFQYSVGYQKDSLQERTRMPYHLRHVDNRIYPVFTPRSIMIEFSGTLSGIIKSLEEIQWLNPDAVIVKLDVRQNTTNLTGNAKIAFPGLLYPQEFERVNSITDPAPSNDTATANTLTSKENE